MSVHPLSELRWPGTGRLRWGRRSTLWVLLVLLVLALLATLVWLAGRYEASQVQAKVERDAADAVVDIRTMLTRNLQNFQALHAESAQVDGWPKQALALLRDHRELLRLEWRDTGLQTLAFAGTPFRAEVFGRLGRENLQSDVAQACSSARRLSSPAYSPSYFLPHEDGAGQEVMDLCMPLVAGGRLSGYLVASYSLPAILSDTVGPQLTRGQEVSFTEVDGTRLALHGAVRRGNRIFTAQQVLNLPGNTVLLRLDSWRAGPDLFPNVLTAMVTVLSIALLSVLALLGKDLRRRLQAERNLADALAFRKAMEDSLVTGLVARDTQGHIRYVNPAFCHMVGYSADALLALGQLEPASEREIRPPRLRPPVAPAVPFWPPEAVQSYREKLLAREDAADPVREGLETVFVRQDGTRFPVLIFEAPLINALGEQTGWMSAFVDVSEQRRIEAISRASQERLQATARLATVGEMASLMSHELNQPLAAISSYATGSLNLLDEMLRGLPAQAGPDSAGMALITDIQGALGRIAEQADRAGKVIRSVHNFVRRREGEHEAVSPQALLDAIMPLVSLQAHKLGVQVNTVLGDDLPLLVCDRTMLEQVLLNLARNGMQAMDEAQVAFEARVLALAVQRDPAGGVQFSVADAGLGIPLSVAEKLFTPFFTTKQEGMGLGLSLCRTVVEQHGGKLEFQNRTPQGTIFRFTLPMHSR
jgi:two-component system, LuxR family, sensor histidine kinase DctS